jgi:molybdopterin-guanine dinucleotide biosynthesis protein B
MLKRVHIVGGKNSGKTTLIVELVAHLRQKGYRVGTIKHTHHEHELDTPGKDSYRHRIAGATTVGILSPRLDAIFRVPERQHAAPERYDELAGMFASCDVVLVEGHLAARAPKIEVWRSATGLAPLAAVEASIDLIVTDDDQPLAQNFRCGKPWIPRSDIESVALEVLRLGDY